MVSKLMCADKITKSVSLLQCSLQRLDNVLTPMGSTLTNLYHTHLGEDNLLIIWPSYPRRKRLGSDCVPIVHALMMQEIMGSNDAQCNTKESFISCRQNAFRIINFHLLE